MMGSSTAGAGDPRFKQEGVDGRQVHRAKPQAVQGLQHSWHGMLWSVADQQGVLQLAANAGDCRAAGAFSLHAAARAAAVVMHSHLWGAKRYWSGAPCHRML